MLELIKSQPLIAFLAALVLITVILTFAFPSIVKITQSNFWDDLSHRFFKIKKFLKTNPLQTIVMLVIIVLIFSVGYFLYLNNQDVVIVSASRFKNQRVSDLESIQKNGFGDFKNSGLYLLDIRGRDEYAQSHLLGSESLPAKDAESRTPLGKVDLVIYSSSLRLSESREVADAIKKNGQLLKLTGKIIIVQDGFEGLKNSGLKTEEGGWIN